MKRHRSLDLFADLKTDPRLRPVLRPLLRIAVRNPERLALLQERARRSHGVMVVDEVQQEYIAFMPRL